MAVYFIQAGDGGPIKIGFASNPLRRLSKMQSDNHERLTILSAIFGNQEDEESIRDQFSHARIHGEWFKPVQQLLDFIRAQTPISREHDEVPSADMLIDPVEMARVAREAGLTMGEVCFCAGIAQSTFVRWHQGGDDHSPNLTTLRKLNGALMKLKAQKSAA